MSHVFPDRWIEQAPTDPIELRARQLLLSSPVPVLAPAARERAWRRIEARTARPAPSLRPALVLAAVAAAAFAALVLWRSDDGARRTEERYARTPSGPTSDPDEQAAAADHEGDEPVAPENEAPVQRRVPRPEPIAPAPAPLSGTAMPEVPAGSCATDADPEACWRREAAGSDLSAQNALYRLGTLLSSRGDVTGALQVWEDSRLRFPEGALRHEVDLAILDARVRSGEGGIQEANTFLTRYPTSERAGEVRVIRGSARLRAGRFAEALDDYRRALSVRLGLTPVSAARAEEALFGVAAALDGLGRTAEAGEAYREYLRAHPDGRFAERAREALERL